MGCPGRRLPPSGTIVQIERKPRAERPKPDKVLRKIIDHHCDLCGYVGPHPQHVCTPKQVAWQETRQAMCNRCPYSRNDVCTLYKSLHPDRDCVISVGIKMPFAWCPAGLWQRTELTCPECESVTFDGKGVHKCKSCGWKPERKVSLPYITTMRPEKPYEPIKPIAIITLAVGQKALDEHAITGPQMAAYAERCNADFHAITDDQHSSYALANKFRLKTLAAKYDRVLFLDADVWVRSTAPNIFEQFDPSQVWMHVDRPHQANRDSFIANYATIAKQQQIEPITDYDCLNSGVVLFSREHLGMWSEPPLPAPKQFLTEQIWIEYNLRRQGFAVGKLPTEWNTQYWFSDFAARESSAYFVHLAACKHEERVYRLRKLMFASREKD